MGRAVEAARVSVKSDPRWKAEYTVMCGRMHEHKAVVAIARKLAEVIWHVLHDSEPAQQISDEQLAKKFLSVRCQLVSYGMKVPPSRIFIRQQLNALGWRGGSSQFMTGKKPRKSICLPGPGLRNTRALTAPSTKAG